MVFSAPGSRLATGGLSTSAGIHLRAALDRPGRGGVDTVAANLLLQDHGGDPVDAVGRYVAPERQLAAIQRALQLVQEPQSPTPPARTPVRGQAAPLPAWLTGRVQWIADRSALTEFLRAHTHVLPLLKEGIGRVDAIFGPAELTLELRDDADEPPCAWLFVHVDDVDDAFTKMRAFDADWWLDVLPETQGNLAVHVRFS